MANLHVEIDGNGKWKQKCMDIVDFFNKAITWYVLYRETWIVYLSTWSLVGLNWHKISENTFNTLYMVITPTGKLSHSVKGYRNTSSITPQGRILEPKEVSKSSSQHIAFYQQTDYPQVIAASIQTTSYDDAFLIRIFEPA